MLLTFPVFLFFFLLQFVGFDTSLYNTYRLGMDTFNNFGLVNREDELRNTEAIQEYLNFLDDSVRFTFNLMYSICIFRRIKRYMYKKSKK